MVPGQQVAGVQAEVYRGHRTLLECESSRPLPTTAALLIPWLNQRVAAAWQVWPLSG